MAEKKHIIDGLELNYSGYFNLNELTEAIDKCQKDRGYLKSEKRTDEKVYPSGKDISIELRPTKKFADYYTTMITMVIMITGMKDVEVEKEGRRKWMSQGNIRITFDGWTTTDFEFRWENNPVFYFLRDLVDKAFYRSRTDRWEGIIIEDTHYFHTYLKAFLNLYRY